MRNFRQSILLAVLFAVSSIVTVVSAKSQSYPQSHRGNKQQIRSIITLIGRDSDQFRLSLNAALSHNQLNNNNAADDNITQFTRDFAASTARLRDRVNNNQATDGDVQDLLNTALRIDSYMNRYRLTTSAQRAWQKVRSDLDNLGNAYQMNWDWKAATSNDGNGRYNADNNNRLTGTYQLDSSRSDDPRNVLRNSRNLPSDEQQRISRRLQSPDRISIEQQGQTITMASSRARQITFDADGQDHQEQISNGRTAQSRANLNADQLVINYKGNSGSDFTATFESFDNGRSLRVTRRLYTEQSNNSVEAHSVYNRISDQPQWDIYTSTQDPAQTYGSNSTVQRGNFIVPDGTRIVAVLDNDLSTQRNNQGDGFTMTVRSPSQYYGAVIQGYITSVNPSGRVSGRAELAISFQQIRTRDGRTFKFDGTMESIRSANGDNLKVSNEGRVEDNSQTNKTVTRGAIGVGIGALIGAIAGGGKGAAIGAAVGGGVGAGSVVVEGRDQLQLTKGAEFTINASAPR